jgi:hypothetical protein
MGTSDHTGFLVGEEVKVKRVDEGTAPANLKEAVELLFESADPSEVGQRLHAENFVTRFESTSGSAGVDPLQLAGDRRARDTDSSRNTLRGAA